MRDDWDTWHFMFWVAWGIAPINSSTSQTRIGFGVLYIVVRKKFMAIKLCLYNWDGNPSVHPTLGSRFWVRALSVFWLNRIDLVVAYASPSMIWMFFRLGSLFEMKLIFCPIYVRRNWRLLWLIVLLSMTGMVSLWFSFETKVLFLPCDMWRNWSLSRRIVSLSITGIAGSFPCFPWPCRFGAQLSWNWTQRRVRSPCSTWSGDFNLSRVCVFCGFPNSWKCDLRTG